MAIQYPNFIAQPTQDIPLHRIFENALKGYKMQREPQKMEDEATLRQMTNKLKQLELEHKPTEYKLSDQQKSLANALSSEALKYLPEKYRQAKELNQARIDKLNRPPELKGTLAQLQAIQHKYPEGSKEYNQAGDAIKKLTNISNGKGNAGAKFNGAVANVEGIWNLEHPPGTETTPEEDKEHISRLKTALQIGLEHTSKGTERSDVLNKTQKDRNLSPITQRYNEMQQIDKGVFPGTQNPIDPHMASSMKNDILLDIIKKVTDPITRDKLINASNMNITLDAVDPIKLTHYSGIPGTVSKMGDAIDEGFGRGSPQYQQYIKETQKVMFAAKQMRLYLKDSIQPSNQEKLEKLSKPEAWNVSPKTAAENFEFMRDLYKRETNTLVRAASDPTLFRPVIQEFGSPTQSYVPAIKSSGSYDFSKVPVHNGGK